MRPLRKITMGIRSIGAPQATPGVSAPACAAARAAQAGRADALGQLIALQTASPDNDALKALLAETYLVFALHDWTKVEAQAGGPAGALLGMGLQLLAGPNLPPGRYATSARHVANLRAALAHAKRLEGSDPEVAVSIAQHELILDEASARRLVGTWGELGLAALYCICGLFISVQSIAAGMVFLVIGAAMIVGSYAPEYRNNRITLERQGKTFGDQAIIALIQMNKGHLIYFGVLVFFFPIIAFYKLAMNWGEGWITHSDIKPHAEEATPALLEARPAEPEPQASASSACPGCGADNRVQARFCKGCGARLSEPSMAPSPAAAPALATVYAFEAMPTPASNDEGPAPAKGPAFSFPSFPSFPRFERETLSGWVERLIDLARRPVTLAIAGGLAVILLAGVGWNYLRGRPTVEPVSAAASAPAHAPLAATATVAPPPSVSTAAPTPSPELSGVATVVDTATLRIAGVTAPLEGLVGREGELATGMQTFLAEQGGEVRCRATSAGRYKCTTAAGYDVASAALINGAAEASPNAAQALRDLQAQAQAAHRGIWR